MPDLYYAPIFAESRACLLVMKALNLDFNLITVNKVAGEHLKPEFRKISPQRIVPVFIDEDEDFKLFER